MDIYGGRGEGRKAVWYKLNLMCGASATWLMFG